MVMAVCVSVSPRIPTLLHGPRYNLGNGRECPLVVHYWADLQSVHGFRCYDNIAANAKCQRVLVVALCLVYNCTCSCLTWSPRFSAESLHLSLMSLFGCPVVTVTHTSYMAQPMEPPAVQLGLFCSLSDFFIALPSSRHHEL